MGDGNKTGVVTDEQFGHFVYVLVTTHAADQFQDPTLIEILENEFPNRPVLTDAKRFQSIGSHRSYARTTPEKLGVELKTEAGRAAIVARISRKMGWSPPASQI